MLDEKKEKINRILIYAAGAKEKNEETHQNVGPGSGDLDYSTDLKSCYVLGLWLPICGLKSFFYNMKA